MSKGEDVSQTADLEVIRQKNMVHIRQKLLFFLGIIGVKYVMVEL